MGMKVTTPLKPTLPILLVDDETQILEVTGMTLRSKGFTNIVTISDSRQVIPYLEQQPVALVILDLMMPHHSGTNLLPLILGLNPRLPVIIMTALYEVEAAVGCMKEGAFDYLIKPVESSRLLSCVDKALKISSLTTEVAFLKDRLLNNTLEKPEAFEHIITCSPRLFALFRYVEIVARSPEAILITGETGVGKELFARAIHQASGVSGEFVSVNIAGLDDTMFSDTLFGHARGAFTGATGGREGLVTKSAGGTLFLDEIGDLDESSQIKLLRLIQQGEYYPVGSDMLRKVDTSIITATSRELPALIEAGKFRRDLYYRISAHQIVIPPLRERPEDIPLLFNHFMETAAESFGVERPTALPEVSAYFSSCTFPGNVRELRALVFDAVARTDGSRLSLDCFPGICNTTRLPLPGGQNLTAIGDARNLVNLFGRFPTIHEMEELLITEALKLTNGNQSAAAALLDISRPTLNKRLHRQ
jgi:DNA-binding NtrC family response regulator